MLLRFNVKNFLSFRKEAAFDMFPNIKREKFSHHIYAGMEVPLLKQAAIYGANGSGKSNFVKALYFLREFVTYDDFLKDVDLDDYIFQLTSKKSSTISFEVEFLQHGRYYIYRAGISKKKIYENLSLSGLGKSGNELLFERSGGHISSPHLQNESAAKQLLSMNSQSSLLPLNLKFPILANNDVEEVYDWFSTKLEVIAIHTAIPMLIKLLSQSPDVLNFANTVFENIGIGIKKVEVSNTPFEQWAAKSKGAAELQQIIGRKPAPSNRNIELLQNNRNVLNVTFQKGIRTVLELLFDQLGQSGFHKEMKISAQSDGTVRLLTLIPVLYSAMYEQKTAVVDEIDNSIHPSLMVELIRFYADSKSNGQLIFTTHTTKLLNQQELVRPDEIWLTEKSDGNTKLYSLNDFKLHHTLNIENGYLDGRYGAVPAIEELSAL